MKGCCVPTAKVPAKGYSHDSVRTAICLSSLETTKRSAPKFWRASLSLLGDVEMTVTSWPNPWQARQNSAVLDL